MIQILIVDDHSIVRKGLQQIVSEEADMGVAGEASSSSEMMQELRKRPYDVVILDVTMPGPSGLSALTEIKRQYPRLPVLMLSMHPEEQYALRALKSGASGYLTKLGASLELVQAIRKVCSGGKYISAAVAETLADGLQSDTSRPPHERLSNREYEVLCMIASGKTVSEIAEELQLSVKTISTYRTHILDKMRMATNAEITRYAVKTGLVA